MSSTAYCVPLARFIDTSNLNDDEYAAVVAAHKNPEFTRDRPAFICLERWELQLPMHPVWRSDRFFLAHYPGGNTDNHSHDPTPMTAEHRNQTEYLWRAAQSAGLKTSDLDRGLPTGNNTVLDLAVWGECDTGFEVQWSALSTNMARLRAARSFAAGWPTVWVTTARPSWMDWVPSLRISDIGWEGDLPAKGTASATITDFYTEVHWPHETRLRSRDRVLLLDDFVRLVVAGNIIAVTGPDGPVFTDASALDMLAEFGHTTWTPDYTPKKRNTNRTRRCHHGERPPEPVASPVVSTSVSRWLDAELAYRADVQSWIDAEKRWMASVVAYLNAEQVSMTRAWLDAERDFVQSWLTAEKRWGATVSEWLDAERDFVQSWLDAERHWGTEVSEWLVAESDSHRPHCTDCGQPMTSQDSISRGHCWRCHYTTTTRIA